MYVYSPLLPYPYALAALPIYTYYYPRHHFKACPHIPQEVRDEYERIKDTSRQSKGTDGNIRWAEAAEAIGLVDCPPSFANAATTVGGSPSPAPSPATASEVKIEDGHEDDDEHKDGTGGDGDGGADHTDCGIIFAETLRAQEGAAPGSNSTASVVSNVSGIAGTGGGSATATLANMIAMLQQGQALTTDQLQMMAAIVIQQLTQRQPQLQQVAQPFFPVPGQQQHQQSPVLALQQLLGGLQQGTGIPSQLGQLQLQPLAASVAASAAVSAPSNGSTPSAMQQQQPQINAQDLVDAASSALGAAASLTSLSTGRQESGRQQDQAASSTSKQEEYSKLRSSSSSSSHPSSSAVDEHSSPSSRSTLSSAQREHLINRVRMAYDLVKNKRESSLRATSSASSSSPRAGSGAQANTSQSSPVETALGRKRSRDESSEPDSEASWDPASSDEENLRALGMKLYEIFAVGSLSPSGGSILPGSSNSDISPDSKQSSNAGDSMDEDDNDAKISGKKSDNQDGGNADGKPPPKKKQKKIESFVPLRELGMPVQLCNMVSSLLSGGQSSFSESEGGTSDSAVAGERPTPLKVEEELHKMISDPDSYLFSSASSASNGSNGSGSTGTSGSTGGSGSMNGSGSSNGSLDASGSVDGDGSDSTAESS